MGDLVEGYNARPEWLEQAGEYRAVMARLRMPWYPVAGNHDIYWRGRGRPHEEHEGDFEAVFGPLWYAFRHRRCLFLVLYSDEGDPATGERDWRKPECQRISDEQLHWLERTLQANRDVRHAFVFLHHPRWQGGPYGNDWERVHRVLSGAGTVRAVFAGHIHHMQYDGRRDGIEYFTLATTGGKPVGDDPAAGYLHEFHLVTVRGDEVSVAAVPVGAVLAPREVGALPGPASP